MVNLSTRYMGIELENPFVLGSSPLSATVEGVIKAEKAGFGAVILRSIFEEQILNNMDNELKQADDYIPFSGAYDFIANKSKDYYIDQYCKLISDCKHSVKIPIIASINCTSQSAWLEYAKRIVEAGADAIELNYYTIAGNPNVTGEQLEKAFKDVLRKTRKLIPVPLSVKISWHYSSIANMVKNIMDLKADGVVLFNHFFRPDIDIEKVEVSHDRIIEPKGDYAETLRWIAMLSDKTDIDFCASTGIRDGETAIKMLLAGAKAVMLTSVVFMQGYDCVSTMKNELVSWMEKHNYNSLEDFLGILSQKKIDNPEKWERSQYLKIQKD